MSHKGKNNAKGQRPAKSSGAERKTENLLQAVVLADSFQDRFKPLTVEKPRCLLPLANIPLIEYTLEFLAMNGVDEVFIYSGAHTDQVEDYVANSRWDTSSPASPFSLLQFIRVSDARSTGDVLRDLDKRSLVDGDFILIQGDVVSNIMLDRALSEHRQRREANPANIMTMILRRVGDHDRTKPKAITPVFVVDSETRRVLQYEEFNALQSDEECLNLDAAVLRMSDEFDMRSDLVDAQIDICTPEVLALWSESFDYELPRRHFLHGVLKDWELNGKMVYADIVEKGYAARASNLQMYDAISRDVLGRWTYPFLPENNLMPQDEYRTRGQGRVIEQGAIYASDAHLKDCVVGRDSTIASSSTVSKSIIGKNCTIGTGVVIENSYIWDNAVIGDGARISQSVLADSVVVGKNCTISAGSVISFGVRIGDDKKLTENTVLSTRSHAGEAVAGDKGLLGPQTNAAIFHDGDLDDLDKRDPVRLEKSLIFSLAGLAISTPSASPAKAQAVADDEHAPAAGAAVASRSRLSSFASEDSTGKMSFHADAVHGLVDALRSESGDFDSAKLEFMGLRFANDASDAMVRKAVATAFAQRAAELLLPEHGSLEPAKAAEKALTACQGAIKFIGEVGVGGGGEREQLEFALELQRALLHVGGVEPARLGIVLAALMQQLYARDILEEEGILGWWQDQRAVESDTMAVLKNKCAVLVEWLENAEEEDDDEDEDDSD